MAKVWQGQQPIGGNELRIIGTVLIVSNLVTAKGNS